MDDLIKAFQVFRKYSDAEFPTHCEHDTLYVCIDDSDVSDEDKAILEELGFHVNSDGGFYSFKYGSC